MLALGFDRLTRLCTMRKGVGLVEVPTRAMAMQKSSKNRIHLQRAEGGTLSMS
jgi:hypothetical protein